MRTATKGPAVVTLAAIAAVTLAVVACGGADVTVHEDASGDSVELEVGQTLEVSLEESPTTGYAWNLTEPPDPAVLSPASDDYESSDPYSEGGGGVRTFVFEAAGPGETGILLEYYFQTDDDQINQTFELNVTVVEG